MNRIWGTGLSCLLHASVAVALGVTFSAGPSTEPPRASVSPAVPMRLVTRVDTPEPQFEPPGQPASSSIIIGADGPIVFSPDHVEVEVNLPEIPPPILPDHRPVLDRPVAPTALRVSEPVARVTAPPSEIRNPAPAYPHRARRHGLEGTVTVDITVRKDGTCGAIQVVERTGSDDFVESVMEALQGWRFTPAMRDGIAVEATHQVRFRFKIQG